MWHHFTKWLLPKTAILKFTNGYTCISSITSPNHLNFNAKCLSLQNCSSDFEVNVCVCIPLIKSFSLPWCMAIKTVLEDRLCSAYLLKHGHLCNNVMQSLSERKPDIVSINLVRSSNQFGKLYLWQKSQSIANISLTK